MMGGYMIINLNELNIKKEILFNYKVLKNDYLDKRINDLKNCYVTGRVYLNNDNIILECIFKGIMIINDSITLDLVPYNFNISINENLNDLVSIYNDCYDNNQNTLDLQEILWQNIVLEVPISYTKVNDANLKGNGWELIREEKEVKEIDPRLKKLEELLERRD